MKKNSVVKFSQLQIGDYFSDSENRKYIKVPPKELNLPNQPPIILNAFYFQSNCYASIDPEKEYIYIKHIKEEDCNSGKLNNLEYTISSLEIEHQIEFFSKYFETIQSFLENELKHESEIFNNDQILSTQEVNEFIDVLYSSFFVSLYSFLESHLNNECKSSQHEDPTIKISLNDLHGKGIERAKKYLTKVLGTSYQFGNSPVWEEIKQYNTIRNCIIHNNNIIKDNKLKEYVITHKNLESVVIFGDDHLLLGTEFCFEAISSIGSFLKTLNYHRRADKIK